MNEDLVWAVMRDRVEPAPLSFDERKPWLASWLGAWNATGKRTRRDTPLAAADFAAKLGFLVLA